MRGSTTKTIQMTKTSTPPRRLLQSTAAVLLGSFAIVVLSLGAHQVLQKRELEIAREAHQQLIPPDHPPVTRLEYAGASRPAFEVGGDYYDFIKISGREFGIAIGDVSEKGIPASLLMATLRAYLGGQTAGQECNLPSFRATLNRFVCDSSSANRYATFLYALHDATRALTCVNGGHNPPVLYRAEAVGGEPIRLDAGGPVVGMLPECSYLQGQVVLSPGNVLVAFTDGVSEAMNVSGEDWGEGA
jgi:phosphoserine phosphatase RsbU/P